MTDRAPPRPPRDEVKPGDTGQYPADRVSPRALRRFLVPGAPPSSDRLARLARGSQPVLDLRRISERIERATDPAEALRLLDPDTVVRLLAQAHMDWFGPDFQAAQGEFIKVRFHVGVRGDPWEFYSAAYPLSPDAFAAVKASLAEHIREELGMIDRPTLVAVPVRVVFFHDPRVRAASGDGHATLVDPLDFATSIRLTVGELVEYQAFGTVPTALRLRFDASYLWLGLDTRAPFRYVKHWEFFLELAQAYAELLHRPFGADDPFVETLREHARGSLADLVIQLGMHDKKSYEGQERVYRPRIEIAIDERETAITVEDHTGILRGLLDQLPAGAYARRLEGTKITLRRRW